ncbi:uncharacterized protein LOC143676895 [Tamandua tetradactyla]|uniref:uncharacterized protein LOC143676895 n=1 Tax=Tamandua tetradactyla TaxID=48850 RepID=UPI0040546C14
MSFTNTMAELLLDKCWMSSSPDFDSNPQWDSIINKQFHPPEAEKLQKQECPAGGRLFPCLPERDNPVSLLGQEAGGEACGIQIQKVQMNQPFVGCLRTGQTMNRPFHRVLQTACYVSQLHLTWAHLVHSSEGCLLAKALHADLEKSPQGSWLWSWLVSASSSSGGHCAGPAQDGL